MSPRVSQRCLHEAAEQEHGEPKLPGEQLLSAKDTLATVSK